MSELESKVTESGGGETVAPASGDEPSPETISAAEALKMEGNALLAGEGWAERPCILGRRGMWGRVLAPPAVAGWIASALRARITGVSLQEREILLLAA